MGGFLGIGGSSQKTDRKTQLTGFGDLQNLFNFGLDTAKGFLSTGKGDVASGKDALSTSLDYFKKLASGDRAVQAAAIAPETNAALSQQDAARKQRATTGTARGGGGAAAEQTSQDQTMAEIDNFLFGARPAAASKVGDIGGQFAQIGLGEQGLGLGFSNLSEKSASDMTSEAGTSRKTSYEINQDTVGKVTDAIDGILTGLNF